MTNSQLDRHPYFEKYIDPKSGVVSYILTEKPTPCIQNFYFCNSGMSQDGKYLWFWGAFPPGPAHFLGVIGMDPDNPFVRYFPAAQFEDASPWVQPDGKKAFYTYKDKVYTVTLDGQIEVFAVLPQEFIQNRPIHQLCTHLTRSADGKYFGIDMRIGNEYTVLILDTETREFKHLCTFQNCHNHLQFSPTNSKEFIIDEDACRDVVSGRYFIYYQRIWLMDTDKTYYRPLNPDKCYAYNSHLCHDFYSDDGYICWIDYNDGAFECTPDTHEITHVWKRPLCHAHCNSDRTLWCADESPYRWSTEPCKMLFYNRKTGEETEIYSAMPQPVTGRAPYHVDPHPRFTPDGKFIAATTTVRNGIVDISLTPVDQLL